MDRIRQVFTVVAFFSVLLVCILLLRQCEREGKLEHILELLEAESEELRIPPVSGQRDEIERKYVREHYQEDAR